MLLFRLSFPTLCLGFLQRSYCAIVVSYFAVLFCFWVPLCFSCLVLAHSHSTLLHIRIFYFAVLFCLCLPILYPHSLILPLLHHNIPHHILALHPILCLCVAILFVLIWGCCAMLFCCAILVFSIFANHIPEPVLIWGILFYSGWLCFNSGHRGYFCLFWVSRSLFYIGTYHIAHRHRLSCFCAIFYSLGSLFLYSSAIVSYSLASAFYLPV